MAGEESGGGGIIIFTLWYIFIAVNYMIAPVFKCREERYQCKCRRAPCNSASNSCDIPDIPDIPDIDIIIPDDSTDITEVPPIEPPVEDIKEDVELEDKIEDEPVEELEANLDGLEEE